MKARFQNKYYILFLIVALLFSIGENLLSYIVSQKIKAVPHIILALIVLMLLLLRSKHLKTMIKVWSMIAVIGGLLVMVSILLFLIGGAPEKIELDKTVVSIAHTVIGGLFFYYCDRAIKIS